MKPVMVAQMAVVSPMLDRNLMYSPRMMRFKFKVADAKDASRSWNGIYAQLDALPVTNRGCRGVVLELPERTNASERKPYSSTCKNGIS